MPLRTPFGPLDDRLRHQMAQFFEATTDAIIFLDREYNITFLNRRACELLSPANDLLGRNLYEVYPMAKRHDLPFAENYRRSMQGERMEFEAFYPEPLNAWFQMQSYPSTDGISIFFRDVTQQKLDREALQRKSDEAERQHAELETIYATAPIGLALFDLDDYHYVRLNDRQAAFFGLTPAQIVGKTLTEMAPIPGLRELFDQVARGEPVINHPLEGTLVTDPNDYRYWTVSYFPVYGADGEIQAITAASLEITQQKKAQQALLQSEKLAVVGRLASSIAHEINNPLESVTNLLYLAQHSATLVEAQGYLASAEVALRRVAAITSQTLRFHKQATSPQAVTAERLISEVLSVYQGRVGNSHAEVRQRTRALEPIRCFEGEIRQVISNLVGNALDALNGEPGLLHLRTRVGTDWPSGGRGVFITIGDTGSGMDQATQQKLFNPFFTTKDVTGTGLGLWVSKDIVDRHFGRLRFRSRKGERKSGTVFAVFLPFDAVAR